MSSDVRAVVIDAFGDSPHLATFPRPEPGPGLSGRSPGGFHDHEEISLHAGEKPSP